MLKSQIILETQKERIYQVLFLTNDSSQDVEVHEGKVVDFGRVEKHLKRGGAVFITGKSSQKIILPKEKTNEKKRKNDTQRFVLAYFNHI